MLYSVASQIRHKNVTTEIKSWHVFVCKKNQLKGTNMIKGKHGSLAPFRHRLSRDPGEVLICINSSTFKKPFESQWHQMFSQLLQQTPSTKIASFQLEMLLAAQKIIVVQLQTDSGHIQDKWDTHGTYHIQQETGRT